MTILFLEYRKESSTLIITHLTASAYSTA